MFIFKQTPTKVIELKEDNFRQEAYVEGFLIENIELLAAGEDSEAKLLGRQIFLKDKHRIDLLVLTLEDEKAKIKVVEIKKGIAGKKALNQLERYIGLWNKKGEGISDRNGMTDTIHDCFKKWEMKKKQQLSALHNKVGGILVAPGFQDEVIGEFAKRKHIEGIRLARYASSETGDAFVFLEHFPEIRKRLPITAEEYWKRRSQLRKRQVEEILRRLRKEDADITHAYWKAMMSIYPTPEEADKARPYRIARHVGGRKEMWFEKGGRRKILLSEVDRIVNKVLKGKIEYITAHSKR